MAGNINQTRAAVKSPTPTQLRAAGILAYLIHCGVLPDLPLRTANAIALQWGVDHSVIESLPVCGYPSEVENICIGAEASARFGDLSAAPGFYRVNGCWRLDLNPRWAETGFLVPAVDRRFGFYTGLLAFRHPRDMKPFTVEVRADGERKQKAA